MVSNNFMDPVAKGFLLMTNILSTVRIEKLVVPEVISSDSRSVALECVYSGSGGDVTVLWQINGSQVYEWSKGTEPRASGILEGRVDLSRETSIVQDGFQRRTLHLVDIIPEMTGDYTCVVHSRGQEARQTKTMIVFSPEREFELRLSRPTQDIIDIVCVAKHLHPQPDLTIEFNKIAISRQQQRIWRIGMHYDAECTAVLSSRSVSDRAEISCRLQIPQVDYTAITKKFINVGKGKSGTSTISNLVSLRIISGIAFLKILANSV